MTSSVYGERTRPLTTSYRGAYLRYRVMAYVTGVMLVLLVFVAVPLKYLADTPGPVAVVGTAHGFLFIVYLLTALDLGVRLRWPLLRLGLVMISGTIPFMSFVAERSVRREIGARATVTQREAARPASSP
jgi:integral membrane protein